MINPIKPAETLVREGICQGSKVTMKFQRGEGRLKASFISQPDTLTIKNAKEPLGIACGYNIHESADKSGIISKVQKVCAETKEGAKLFAEIMGWLK